MASISPFYPVSYKKVEILQGDNRTKDNKIKALESDNGNLQSENEGLRTRISDQEKDIETKGATIKHQNVVITEHKGTIATLESERIKLGKALKETRHQIEVLKEELKQAQSLLLKQKPIVEAYLVDEARDAMVSGDASMAVIYSGDATVAMEENEDLDYVVPKEGSNVWFDCFLIPKTAEHKEAAEKFIDYMNRQDIAQKNFDYIYYGTPNRAVYDTLDDETKEDYTIFPEEATLDKCEVYKYLGEKTDQYYNRLWKELKSY